MLDIGPGVGIESAGIEAGASVVVFGTGKDSKNQRKKLR